MRGLFLKAGVLSGVSLFSTAATAGNGGLLVFAPASFAVPVFSGPMLIGMSLLFSVIAFRVLKNGRGANRVAGVAVLAAGVLVTSLSGVEQVRSSSSTMPDPGECNTGGEIHFDSNQGLIFENTCPNDLVVVRLETDCPLDQTLSDLRLAPEPQPREECEEGRVVVAGGSCEVDGCLLDPED